MDRREFVRKLGVGGVLLGLGLVAGVGCVQETEVEPQVDPTPPPDEGAQAPAGASEEKMTAVCPKCGAENEVAEWGAEITCWKCAHKWAPQEPA